MTMTRAIRMTRRALLAGLALAALPAGVSAAPRVRGPVTPPAPRTRVLPLAPGRSETFRIPPGGRWVPVTAELIVWDRYAAIGEPPRVQLDGPGRPAGMDCSWHVLEEPAPGRPVRLVATGLLDCAGGRLVTLRSVGVTGSIVVRV
jgi:hypothetical protein